jgi:hypothetical protein
MLTTVPIFLGATPYLGVGYGVYFNMLRTVPIFLGATPYPGMSAMEVMRNVLQGQYLQRPLHCKEEM